MPWKTFSDYRGTGWNAEWFVGLSVGLLDSPREKDVKIQPYRVAHNAGPHTRRQAAPTFSTVFSNLAKSKSILVIESCYTNHP